MKFPGEDSFKKVTLRSQPHYQVHKPVLNALASFDARDLANERDWFSHLAQFIFQTCPSSHYYQIYSLPPGNRREQAGFEILKSTWQENNNVAGVGFSGQQSNRREELQKQR